MSKVFSVPLNPKLTEQQYYEFLGFLEQHKEFIADVYFTSRIAPFNQDAMGDVFVLNDDKVNVIKAALFIQEKLDIPVSATFNNIQVTPSQENLDTWITSFKPLYDAGVRTVTLPHTHWMATGQIKAYYPDLYVKNTILRDVSSASEIVALAKYGFDYINLDRDLMRDRETLIRLKEAKEWVKKNLGKDIKFSLLANEGCLGNCPMMVEHFQFNCDRSENTPQYFNDPISRVSCPKWDVEDAAVHLKTANLPPWKEDWEEFLELGIDVFKMHGRESVTRLYETMNIINSWACNEEILFEGFEDYLQDNNLQEKPIMVWRQKIKTCKFDCWECQYCDKIYKKKSDKQHSDKVKFVVNALNDSANRGIDVDVPGLTSWKVKTLINTIASNSNVYLEVGGYIGATFCSALKDNKLKAYCVDNWKENIQPARDDINTPENSLEVFKQNALRFKGQNNITIIDADFNDVDLMLINDKVDFFFYDGPHDHENTKKALIKFAPILANETVLIFDDANWDGVVSGVTDAIQELGLQVSYSKTVLNKQEDPTKWWNGLHIVIVNKG